MPLPSAPLSVLASAGKQVTSEQTAELVASALPRAEFRGKRVLLIVPDNTRTAPVGMVFKAIHHHLGGETVALDVLVALGTHPPMTEDGISQRLEITTEERRSQYSNVHFFNHEWDNPLALKQIGILSPEVIRELSSGHFELEVPVKVNRRIFDYDELIIIGPVFPHEVAGFSGGNKYFFPGISGREVLDFFHWLGAIVTNMETIGRKWTAVRRVIDRAGALIDRPKTCFAIVVEHAGASGIYVGTPETAWEAAADHSAQRHIVWHDRPYTTILSCAAPIYDELWTGAKAMYKLEPVLAEGGELIIYAPHIREISLTHGRYIREVGYHCRDYFLGNWDRFQKVPWGTLAHCTHVYGTGTYVNGREKPRARVTLATGIPETVCREINLGYRDWKEIQLNDYARREAEGILLVPKSGETLHRLRPSASTGG
jgi:lactate racemase